MTDPVLIVERKGSAAWLTLNRPSTKNALDLTLADALGRAVPEAARDPAVRVVVLTGAGGAFSSGADLRAGLSGDGSATIADGIERLHGVIRAIVEAPKPFIAAVDGAAVGFGCDLALSCDLRVLSTRAYLQAIFVKIGLMPDGGGTFFLPRLVGLGRALEYLLLGTRIDAALAREAGLANRVVAPEDFLSAVEALASDLAAGPPLAHERIKRAVRESVTGTVPEALEREKASQLELLGSEDVVEGVMAWASTC
jgi:enoyl-CoA hydratase/carnithine racemase